MFEYDFEEQQYTTWSREQNQFYHPLWLQLGKVFHASYDPSRHHRFVLCGDTFLAVIDKTQVGFVLIIGCLGQINWQQS